MLGLLLGVATVWAAQTSPLTYLEAGRVYDPIEYPIVDGNALAGKPVDAPVGLQEPQTAQSLIYELWGEKEGKVMERIFACESGNAQHNEKGEVIVSHTFDRGYAQIHAPIWEKKAIELGYDIDTEEGNIRMAYYIWKVQGRQAWVCSRLLGII